MDTFRNDRQQGKGNPSRSREGYHGKGPVRASEDKEIRRLYKETGSVEKVADTLDRDERTISKHLKKPQSRQAIESAYEKHIQVLLHVVETLRACTYNVDAEARPEAWPNELVPMMAVDDEDWSLDPIMWFRLCTPDLQLASAWGERLPQLRQHLPKWELWQKWEDLRKMSMVVHGRYRDAIGTAGSPEVKSIWNRIEDEREKYVLPSRVPTAPRLPVDRPLPYSDHHLEVVTEVLKAQIPNLLDLQLILVSTLQELNKLLGQDERLVADIRNGSCKVCLKLKREMRKYAS